MTNLFLFVATLAAARCTATDLPPGFEYATQAVGSGAYIRYIVGGKGEPVMLVHGFGEAARMWRPLLPVLGKYFKVIAPNLPGLDGSSFMPDTYDMKNVSQRLHTFIHRLGYTRIGLVGHDIGLMAVSAYAIQYPDEVSRLALMESAIPGVGDLWPQVYNDPRRWHFQFVKSSIALKLVKGRERTFLDHFWIDFSGDPSNPAIPESDRRSYAKMYAEPGAMQAMFGYFLALPQDAIDNQKLLAGQGKLPMPILTIEGAKAMRGNLSKQVQEAALDVRSVVIPGAGHWLMEERPHEVHALLLEFLRGEEPGKPSQP